MIEGILEKYREAKPTKEALAWATFLYKLYQESKKQELQKSLESV